MNILTDVLSLLRRGVFAKVANPDDVFIIGVNEQPDMTGVASPIPYKSVKLIKVKDLKIAPAFCDNENTLDNLEAGFIGVFKEQIIDPVTNVCTNYFKSLHSLSPNLSITESIDGNFIELDTLGEPNLAANLGTGAGLYASKVGETLNFKSLKGVGVYITQSATEVTLNYATRVVLTAPDGGLWQVTVNDLGVLETALIS